MRRGIVSRSFIICMGILFFAMTSPEIIYAQQSIGGPYTPDSSTVLLMHFNETLVNESDHSADGRAEGEITYTGQSGDPLGQQVRFENDSPAQDSYIWIPDTATLDLTGSWTVEMWLKPNYPINQEDVFYSFSPLIKPDTVQVGHNSKTSPDTYAAAIPSQPLGAQVDYFVSASTEFGMESIRPRQAYQDSQYYSFAVWEDSSRVLNLNFDEGEGIPEDQSQYNIDVDFHSQEAEPEYTEGDEGPGDRAMEFTAINETWLELSSLFLQLGNATIKFKFMLQDSLPAGDTRVLAKGPADKLYLSSYQAEFESGGVFRPWFYLPGNSIKPCEEFAFKCLTLNEQTEHPLKVGEWYRVYMSVRDTLGPSNMERQPGTIFVRMRHMATDSLVGYRLHRVDANMQGDTSSLKLGGVGDASYAPYFNGVIDDVQIYNYMTKRCVPGPCPLSVAEPAEIPDQVSLGENYPNPFNPTTKISYKLPRDSKVRLKVFDILGRKVATLVNGKRTAGEHEVKFNAANLSSGVYIYRLKADGVSRERKMLLLK